MWIALVYDDRDTSANDPASSVGTAETPEECEALIEAYKQRFPDLAAHIYKTSVQPLDGWQS